MRGQVEDAEINDADVATDVVKVVAESHLTPTLNSHAHEHHHSCEYCHSPIPPPKSKVGGYIGMREGE